MIEPHTHDRDWLDICTFIVALVTLFFTSYFAFRSAKASERSAKSSDESAKSSAASSETARESLRVQREFNEQALATQKASLDSQEDHNQRSFQNAQDSLQIQREHNYKSVTPILRIETRDHNEEVSIKLFNDGIGPLILTNVVVTNGLQSSNDLISWMPAHPKRISYWKTFISGFGETSIRPGDHQSLLFLANQDEDLPDYALFRHLVRTHLSKLTITVSGQDIYGRALPSKTKNLAWFGRTVPRETVEQLTLTLGNARNSGFSVEEWDAKIEQLTRKLNG